jgi:2-haloacid dehalogenase
MARLDDVKALVFDVFGTVVDWRTSLINDLTRFGGERGIEADWTSLVDAWRQAYIPSMDEVRKKGESEFLILDELHRRSLERLVQEFGVAGPGGRPLDPDELRYINLGWHRLAPWPDAVAGLTRLKGRYVIAPLSNGNVALLTNMAKHSGLPWDLVLSAELFRHYKPDPETYLGSARLLGLEPGEVMMVAAHNGDLAAAQRYGLQTAFVPRITEYGPLQSRDFKAEGDWTVVADDFGALAAAMGC